MVKKEPEHFKEYLHVVRKCMRVDRTKFLGVRILKNPIDLMVIQELIYQIRPRWVIETGTHSGGSALAWASVFELMHCDGEVITIDIKDRVLPSNNRFPHRVHYLSGRSSIDQLVIAEVADLVGTNRAMVILDSNHSQEHVYRELELYNQFVSLGSYLVVEDGCMRRGPFQATKAFLRSHKGMFVADREVEPPYTFNLCGYLKRVKE